MAQIWSLIHRLGRSEAQFKAVSEWSCCPSQIPIETLLVFLHGIGICLVNTTEWTLSKDFWNRPPPPYFFWYGYKTIPLNSGPKKKNVGNLDSNVFLLSCSLTEHLQGSGYRETASEIKAHCICPCHYTNLGCYWLNIDLLFKTEVNIIYFSYFIPD